MSEIIWDDIEELKKKSLLIKKNKKKNKKDQNIYGKNISGRVWKTPEKERNSKCMIIPAAHLSLSEIISQKNERISTKEKERELLNEIKQKKEVLRKSKEERKRKQQENEWKSSSFQIITNPKKLKKMTKQQKKKLKIIS